MQQTQQVWIPQKEVEASGSTWRGMAMVVFLSKTRKPQKLCYQGKRIVRAWEAAGSLSLFKFDPGCVWAHWHPPAI